LLQKSSEALLLAVPCKEPTANRSSPACVVHESATVFAMQVLGLCCALIGNALVAWMIGPEGKAVIYLLQVISGIGLTLLNFGLGPASVFRLGRESSHSISDVASGVLWASLLLGSLPILVLWPSWHWAGGLTTQKFGAGYFWLALAVIPAMNLMFNVGFVCLGQKRIGTYNWLRISPSVLFSLALLAVLVTNSRTIRVVALAWAATSIVPGLFALEVVRKVGGMKWSTGTQDFLRSAFRFGWHSHLGAVTQYLQHRSDILLVSYFLPIKELGLYAFAVSLAELLWYVPHAVGTVLMPYVANSAKEDASYITAFVCRTTLALTALLSVGLALAATWLVPRMLPAFQSSVRVLWILVPGVVAASIFKVLSSDFNGRGKPIETFYPAVIALGAGLVCGILVIPHFGICGAAVVTTGGYVLNSWLYVRSYTRMTAVSVSSLLFLHSEDFVLAASLRHEWSSRAGD
jgi:stage V sporulation protein B